MLRYSSFVHHQTLLKSKVLIVGVGAVGLQIARTLAAMGVGSITLMDHDKVEAVNLGTQGWREDQLGLYKVQAATNDLEAINPQCHISSVRAKFSEKNATIAGMHDVVFCCVDSMEARKVVFAHANPVFIDARMSAFTICSLMVDRAKPGTAEDYAKTLFSDKDAHQAPCTARGTYYTALIAAGMSVNLWFQHLMGHVPLYQSILYLDQMVLQGGLAEIRSPEPDEPEDSNPESTEHAPASHQSSSSHQD
jgi:hypothetical protein